MGDVYQVTSGRLANCAVRNDGKGFCWGYSQYVEELGVGWNAGEVDVPHAIYGNQTWLKYAPADFQIYPYGGRLELSWTGPTATGYGLAPPPPSPMSRWMGLPTPQGVASVLQP